MTHLEIEQAIGALVSKMTVAEKVWMCHGTAKFRSGGVERLGVPEMTMSDGPHGVRKELCDHSWDSANADWDHSSYLPTLSAVAATWSRACAKVCGEALGAEARERGKDIILGPGVNIVRTPLCGRNFEYYGEDPFQVGELAVETIRGIQSQGTAACVKHYAMNSQELNRGRVDVVADERTVREIYLPAFEAAVKRGDVLAVMGAYNRFRGQWCCQNDYLLNRILKTEWGFAGLTVSDWAGVNDTCEAAKNGMDIEMGSDGDYDDYYLGKKFREAVEQGRIEETLLDDKVRRILRVMYRIGKLGGGARPKGERNTEKHHAIAREVAEESIVLLKNDDAVLPLDPSRIRKLLIVGENALRKHHAGGNSSGVKSLYEVSPLEGVTARLKGLPVEIECLIGYPKDSAGNVPQELLGIADDGAGTNGWVCEIFDDAGKVITRIPMGRAVFAFSKLPERFRDTARSAKLTGVITPLCPEKWSFTFASNAAATMIIDGQSHGPGTLEMAMTEDRPVTFELLITRKNGNEELALSVSAPSIGGASGSDDVMLDAARNADAVLFFGGLTHDLDTEGIDRKDMQLPGGQDELIAKINHVAKKFAVVLVGGSPMEMPWADDVKAIALMWYSGMECGNAIARILFGDVNPSGRLPVTFPVKLGDSPAHFLSDYAVDRCRYDEGVLVGYRWFDTKRIAPLFRFGHGLSYTTFKQEWLGVEKRDGKIHARIRVTNTGSRAGRETVMVFVEPPAQRETQFVRPARELKGFDKLSLAPGESRETVIVLDDRSFAIYDPFKGDWHVERGEYTMVLGNAQGEPDATTRKPITL